MADSSRAINSFPSQLCGSRFTGPCSLAIGLDPIAVVSLAILAIISVDAARAATIRDGDDFSISIGNPVARVCIIFPQSARDPAACAGLTFPAQPPTDSGRRDLAIGLIRFIDRGAAAKASLAVTFIPESDSVEPDNAKAEAFAREVEQAYTREHPGTSVRGGTSLIEMRVVARLKVVRVAYDVDGLNSDDRPWMEHHIFYFTWAEGGVYWFMLSTGGDHAAAVDAIADSSALTLRVSHPAQPSLLSRERKPLVALVMWFMFAVGTAIDLLWAFLRREPRFAPPTSLASVTAGTPFQNSVEFDVSAPARLRKPIRSAARALKIIGLFSAFGTAISLYEYLGYASLVCVLAVLWCSFGLSKRVRSGSTRAAALASVWCALCACWVVFRVLPHLTTGVNFYRIIGDASFVILIGFLARGLVPFRTLHAFQKDSRNAGDPLANHPWEEGLYIRKHPRFVNKRSISGHFFVLLAPLPYLWVWTTSNVIYNGNVGDLLGQYTAVTCIGLGMLAWGTRIYRRARKEAMLPGSELVKKDSRPIVLYLRSFHDDSKIKLRARATDGRILLERLVKISFEELVTDHLWGYGPVLAIGNPGTKGQPAPLGAARDYVTDASWQETATQLMRQASMIVAIAAATPGLAWEIGTVAERGFMAKLALLLPPLKSGELEARWQFLLSGALGASLPSQINLSRARAVVFPGGHPILITANERNEWTYEAVLDEAALLIASQPSSSPLGPWRFSKQKQDLGRASSISGERHGYQGS